MSDQERLSALYTSQPENKEQTLKKVQLITELELRLGIREPDTSALVEHGDLSDIN